MRAVQSLRCRHSGITNQRYHVLYILDFCYITWVCKSSRDPEACTWILGRRKEILLQMYWPLKLCTLEITHTCIRTCIHIHTCTLWSPGQTSSPWGLRIQLLTYKGCWKVGGRGVSRMCGASGKHTKGIGVEWAREGSVHTASTSPTKAPPGCKIV